MPTLKLKLLNRSGYTLAASQQGEHASLVYSGVYQPGDWIALETDTPDLFCMIQFEDSMAPALVFMEGTNADYHIPPTDDRINYSPKSFNGARHLIRARIAGESEISARRCLSFNPYDDHGEHGFYPHANANVETRGEPVFAARNAIDGIFENTSHGEYPYESWGINCDPNAQLQIKFGRAVTVDEIRLTLRADFPHDNYWTKATVEFSDGTSETLLPVKTADTQTYPIMPHTVTSAVLKDLIMAEGSSPFPALTQIEFYGTEAK